MSILAINQLVKRKGNSLLLPEINLQISSGQCVVLQCNNELGHLLIQLITGTVPASSGDVLFEGSELRHQFKNKSHKIGISLLNEGLYERLKVKDYLQFFKSLYEATASIENILSKVGLLNQQNNKVSTLSFSERKRLQLGKCIIHNPDLLILEEPEQNVDIESHIIIRALISELLNEGKAILITTSYLADAISLTNDVYRLNELELKKLDIVDEPEPDHQSDNQIDATSNDVQEEIIKGTMSEAASEHEQPSEEPIQAEVAPLEPLRPIQIEALPIRVEKIPAKVEDKIILFDPTEIDFIESSDGICLLQVKGEPSPCTFTLNELEQKLKAFGFFRCHRSYIVNLQKVREVITWTRNSFSLILDDNKKSSIPLSKGKYDELKLTLGISGLKCRIQRALFRSNFCSIHR